MIFNNFRNWGVRARIYRDKKNNNRIKIEFIDWYGNPRIECYLDSIEDCFDHRIFRSDMGFNIAKKTIKLRKEFCAYEMMLYFTGLENETN